MLKKFLPVLVGIACSAGAAVAAEPLKIVRPAIHQIEDGPAVGDRVGFVPGETVYLSFEVQNFALGKERNVALTWTVEAFDPKGIPIDPAATGKTQANLQPEDTDWVPRVRQPVVVPSPAPGGVYSIRMRVTDENSKQTASGEAHFSVTGPAFAEPKGLEVRGFGFYRSEEEPQPLISPTFRPGDTLFARFQIAGYKYGEKNLVSVTYGVSVLGPAGNVMYRQDPALEEKSASFYPKPYVDASMNLSLNPGTKAGEYVLVIHVKDQNGGETAEIRKPFRVES